MVDGQPDTIHGLGPAPGECATCRHLECCRLGLGEISGPPLAPTATATCPDEWEAGPGVAHGGWTAAVLDEFLGRALAQAGRLSVTAELTIRYRKPVPVGRPIRLQGHVIERRDGRWHLAAEAHLQDSGIHVASAQGTWVERDPEHWAPYRR